MQKSLNRWRAGVAVAALALAAGPAVQRAQADAWNKRTVLTVNQPIEIADTVLQPGKYILELPNGNSDRHTVFVFNGDQTRLIETVLTIPAQRLQLTGKTQFTYWETPAGTAKALRDWYYPGDNFGQEFPYPKKPQQIALLQPPVSPVASSVQQQQQTPAAQPPATTPATDTTPQPATPPVTDNTQSTTPPVSDQTQTPVTDTTPQPVAQPPAAEQTPAQPTDNTGAQGSADRAAELPRTGSRYPLLGLSGVILLGFAGLLKVLRPNEQ